ncbi:MAG: hypothetical protein ACTHKA_09800 [Anaerocolumna jejuensis]|jgi:hypothetical protein
MECENAFLSHLLPLITTDISAVMPEIVVCENAFLSHWLSLYISDISAILPEILGCEKLFNTNTPAYPKPVYITV